MKIVLVVTVPIQFLPPVISLIKILNELSYKVEVVAKSADLSIVKYLDEIGIKGNYFEENTIFNNRLMQKLVERDWYWERIIKIYDENTILWIADDRTAAILGKKLFKYKYILNLFELAKEVKLNLFSKISLKVPLYQYAKNSLMVVVPENCRAYITKAWFSLDYLPVVIPNKPIYHPRKKKLKISDSHIESEILKLNNKKILLYQGSFGKDRDLSPFIKVINILQKDGYHLVLMGNISLLSEEILQNENITCISYMSPPNHLEVTSHAHTGLLSYLAVENSNYSELNPIFCAPNKIYEYSGFGLPMIGNNIPGLEYTIGIEKAGLCVDFDNVEKICEAILNIDKNYCEYSTNSISFFENVDITEIIKGLMFDILKEKK